MCCMLLYILFSVCILHFLFISGGEKKCKPSVQLVCVVHCCVSHLARMLRIMVGFTVLLLQLSTLTFSADSSSCVNNYLDFEEQTLGTTVRTG